MAYILVTLTAAAAVGIALAAVLLGKDRVFPGQRFFEYVSTDGVALTSGVDPAHVLSDNPSSEELKRVKFATSVAGYNKDEVDQFVQLLLEQNAALRERVSQHPYSAFEAAETPHRAVSNRD
ncbi:DivIVA domain-containing protein [Rothia sp. ZJ932]|uniref:DivIVA domain-containing protein n=1 Tax=Rothia sp. ZJ932 TaxID=2810516 RepID=UPI0019680A52|nr:DivIVA domain-containing protein [Rothia sp. ZJ932]QRZ62199.1 DivIVA domain-containing protein [Rothia sp. ZJ932]